MLSTEFDLSQACFMLDCDQDDYLQLPQAQATPKVNDAQNNH